MRLSLVDGKALAPDERKPLQMMTDAEIKAMRDRVPSMTISEAAKLPIYDSVRGAVVSGHPAERYFAAVDGAKSDPADLQTIDRLASQHLYEQRLSNAWKGDGAPAAVRSRIPGDNGQAAYEKRLNDAWKG